MKQIDRLTQKKIVSNIVKIWQPIRTEEIKIKAMYEGVSCADRYLRYLAKDGFLYSVKAKGDRTKTWWLTGKEYSATSKSDKETPAVEERRTNTNHQKRLDRLGLPGVSQMELKI